MVMRTIVLHGSLAQSFGERFDLEVISPIEAIRALIVQIKGFRQEIREGQYRVLKGRKEVLDCLDEDELRLRLGRAREVHIVPVIAGAARGWGKILAGVAIVGLAIAAPFALGMASTLSGAAGAIVPGTAVLGLSGISFGTIAGLGAAVALGGIAHAVAYAEARWRQRLAGSQRKLPVRLRPERYSARRAGPVGVRRVCCWLGGDLVRLEHRGNRKAS